MVQTFHSTCQDYEKIVQDPNIKHKEKFFLANSLLYSYIVLYASIIKYLHTSTLYFCKVFFCLKVMASDMQNLGYLFEWGKVDAQQFLLPQRRNRIYATADLNAGQDQKEYQERMTESMRNMASDVLLSFDSVFDTSLPSEELEGRAQDKVQEALDHARLHSQSQNVFIDTSTSQGRQAESAVNVLTCVRPTHKIYSQQLQRCVTVKEMWVAQGMFKNNFANPAVVDKMLQNQVQAQDLAGNAFASTCMQAKVLSSLIHSQGWVQLAEGEQDLKHQQLWVASSESGLDDSEIVPTPDTKSSSSSRKRTFSCDDLLDDRSNNDAEKKVSQDPCRFLLPKRRCIGKTSPSDAMIIPKQISDLQDMKQNIEKKQAGRDAGKGHFEMSMAVVKKPEMDPPKKRKYESSGKVSRNGKSSCLTIWTKMKLFEDTRLCL